MRRKNLDCSLGEKGIPAITKLGEGQLHDVYLRR